MKEERKARLECEDKETYWGRKWKMLKEEMAKNREGKKEEVYEIKLIK